VIVLGDSPCERIGKMGGDLSDFERGQNGARVFKVISAYTNHGKTTSAKRNSEQNLTLTGRDRRTLRRVVLKNYRTTAAQVAADIHLEDPVSTTTVQHELHKSNMHDRAANC
jgi:hypothetical protein